MSRYHLVAVSATGYHLRETFTADSAVEAHQRHIDAWARRGTSNAIAMRDAQGRRYSCEDSRIAVAPRRDSADTEPHGPNELNSASAPGESADPQSQGDTQ